MPVIFTGHDLNGDGSNDLFLGHRMEPAPPGCFGGLILTALAGGGLYWLGENFGRWVGGLNGETTGGVLGGVTGAVFGLVIGFGSNLGIAIERLIAIVLFTAFMVFGLYWFLKAIVLMFV